MNHEFHLFDVNSWKRHLAYGRIHHYLWAIIFVLTITWLKVNFNGHIGISTPFLLYAFSIFLSTYIGGLGPGLLALVFSALIIHYLFLLPAKLFSLPERLFFIDQYSAVPITIYLIQGILIIFFVSKLRYLITLKNDLEQQKDDFISASSHELNTPLTSMKIYLDILDEQLRTKRQSQLKEPVTILKDQNERLIRLVGSMLDITRLRGNKIIFKNEEVNLSECVATVVKGLEKTAPLHQIIVEGTTAGKVWGDTDRLCQVISNLLTNAIKYSPSGGEIRVTLKEDQSNIELSVKDSGIGIEKAHHKKLFDRFYRAVDTRVSTFSGLGIGLYLSAEIIKKHKGKIWVESEKGKGSIFYFRLPVI
jgi:signal transduction histidine kinase